MNKIYEYVQKNIINQLKDAIENGSSYPWQKPWIGYNRPKNYVTQKEYSGINLLLLPIPGEYITFKQIKKLNKSNPNVKLKKGSKSNMVVFWKFTHHCNKDDEVGTRKEHELHVVSDDLSKNYPIFRYYNVFHISCVEGLKPHDNIIQNSSVNPILEAENLISAYSKEVNIKKVEGSNRCYYNVARDFISVPNINQFENETAFYSAVFHEMIHSTGHKSRLDRLKNEDQFQFSSQSYSKEELVAEIGACMIMSKLKIEKASVNKNSVSYIYGWLRTISEDIKLITFAAQQAEKAVNFIETIENSQSVGAIKNIV
ncbi:MAG: zincin-like metallopeptidase domain-containing protein [Clostridium tyrobutyricum]|jgi:antirestriction protein ArdC|uniref:ArdC family protein n=1 Tax=Clostridium tyrobutyricum TaxID=1519 RepID=UPI002431978B|nr:zincin-like metallopeptidase domain-containing protein [Clostridium tyrobutyricum]MCH4200640.1 zincin-like metallopeptidase domain-containing protein [Clostridium tyrobutyricum]MCH4237538.1 zincin-like metallopeptidase domain-containing protein [Clostridium tyrobutyricum]MCH4260151.1 zincin-like metallopeptidase domain-containing protein [Clostridium tyrobutyricum]MCI2011739.1 zincin-like metallopeptidase domain-containing protein [Clostridium tyrobutyricum]